MLTYCPPGMLRRWDDSQNFLSDNPHLVCEETANFLVVICVDFEIDEVSVYACSGQTPYCNIKLLQFSMYM